MAPFRTGYAGFNPYFSTSTQLKILKASGIPEDRVYIEELGFTLESALSSLREPDEVVECAYGFRALGDSQKQIREMLEVVKASGRVIIDTETKQRSDADGAEMFDAALRRISREGIAPSPAARSKGGKNSVKARQLTRDEQKERVAPTWHDKRIPRDQDAVAIIKAAIGKGWSRATCNRVLGPSGRKPGRRVQSLAAE